MRSRMCVHVAAVVLAAAAPASAQDGQFRTFPQFVGAWMLDEAASTGRLRMAPPPARRLTIATTTTAITVTRELRLEPPGFEGRRLATEEPTTEIYRLDGAPTLRYGPNIGQYEYADTFVLVADMLALTTKTSNWVRRGDPQMTNRDAFTMVTDAYSVEGDVLTVYRQLTSVNSAGEIHVMQEPANNLRQTYVYRRAPAPAAE
jgi:hypothetical protein